MFLTYIINYINYFLSFFLNTFFCSFIRFYKSTLSLETISQRVIALLHFITLVKKKKKSERVKRNNSRDIVHSLAVDLHQALIHSTTTTTTGSEHRFTRNGDGGDGGDGGSDAQAGGVGPSLPRRGRSPGNTWLLL